MSEKENAFKARILYNNGFITRAEAEKMIEPYKNKFNETSKALAEKYGQRPKLFNLASFLR